MSNKSNQSEMVEIARTSVRLALLLLIMFLAGCKKPPPRTPEPSDCTHYDHGDCLDLPKPSRYGG